MAVFETKLRSILASRSALTDLIGGAVNYRIYAGEAPQTVTEPYLVFEKSTARRIASHSGNSGLARTRYTVHAYGKNYDEANNVAQQVILALHGKGGTWDTGKSWSALVDTVDDFRDETSKMFRVAVDASIWHQEATT